MMMKIIKFIISLILALVAYLLMLPVEIANFIVVAIKHWRGALDYFDKTWYRLDVISASRNRSLWNTILIKKWGYRFVEGTPKTISYHIGENYNRRTLTVFWKFLYWLLYVIDFSTWNEWGHCQSSVDYFNSKK